MITAFTKIGAELKIPLQCVRHKRHNAGQRVLMQRVPWPTVPLLSEILPYDDAEGPRKIVLIRVIRQKQKCSVFLWPKIC
uniref:Uncharacterized protein n=1 Tax=Globodera rostochiensis TaxID=31243 RepID=A0A914IF18_GLORO